MSSGVLSDFAHLRDPRTRANLQGRNMIRAAARGVLHEEGFVEVDTPILGSKIEEYIAGHMRAETSTGESLWLAQSPQVYKQMLMAAGYPRYFQFAHCFRDEFREPGRTDCLREFVQLDIEMTTTSTRDVMDVAERIARRVCDALSFPVPSSPFPTMDAVEAVRDHGSDKPDLRSESDELSFVWVVDFPLAEPGPNGEPVLVRHPMALPRAAPESAEDLLRVRTHSFDLVLNGCEIASGDLRIHEPAVQAGVVELAGLAPAGFAELLEVLRDCPPHGGLGLGFDRLAMQFLGAGSVAEVTGFPHGFGY